MRRLLHAVVLVAVWLAGVAAALVVIAWLLFQTPPGQKLVLGKIEALARQRHVGLHAGGISGNLFDHLELHDVTLAGVGRAERVGLDYTLAALLGGRWRARVAFSRLPLELSGSASTVLFTGDAEVEPAADGFTLRGRGSYARRVIDPSLGSERWADERAGGSFTASGRGRSQDGRLDAQFTLNLAEAGQAARLAAGADLPSPARSTVVVRGSLVVPDGGRPRLRAEVVSHAL